MDMIGSQMKLRWSPVPIVLIGVALLLGSMGYVLVWLHINPPSLGLSDEPSAPESVRLAGLAGLVLIFYGLPRKFS